MAREQIALAPAGACMVVRRRSENVVICPHCGEAIALQEAGAQEERLSMACPRCAGESLLVRVVSVLHRAVRLPGELLSQLGRELDALAEPVDPAVRTPAGVYTLSVSRGAMLLLAMMWHRAERTGSTEIEATVAQLARRLTATRLAVRRWLVELVDAGVLRELSAPGVQPRVWELLPIPPQGKEVGRG